MGAGEPCWKRLQPATSLCTFARRPCCGGGPTPHRRARRAAAPGRACPCACAASTAENPGSGMPQWGRLHLVNCCLLRRPGAKRAAKARGSRSQPPPPPYPPRSRSRPRSPKPLILAGRKRPLLGSERRGRRKGRQGPAAALEGSAAARSPQSQPQRSRFLRRGYGWTQFPEPRAG